MHPGTKVSGDVPICAIEPAGYELLALSTVGALTARVAVAVADEMDMAPLLARLPITKISVLGQGYNMLPTD